MIADTVFIGIAAITLLGALMAAPLTAVAQVWDPSGAIGLDAGVFQASGISAASLRKAIISSSRPDSPDLSVSDASLSGKHVTVVVNQASGTTLYLYDHRDDVFYTGGSGPSVAAQFLGQLP